ncbi:MAG TPA: hypothetical protein VKS80_13960 [Trinickia sp.]|nr:hypothetical protein [Trinickia sp.]
MLTPMSHFVILFDASSFCLTEPMSGDTPMHDFGAPGVFVLIAPDAVIHQRIGLTASVSPNAARVACRVF